MTAWPNLAHRSGATGRLPDFKVSSPQDFSDTPMIASAQRDIASQHLMGCRILDDILWRVLLSKPGQHGFCERIHATVRCRLQKAEMASNMANSGPQDHVAGGFCLNTLRQIVQLSGWASPVMEKLPMRRIDTGVFQATMLYGKS
ncbi:hypothetical protein FMN50_23970 [Rhodobacterales bacterium]|nr:hypothetical protein FMN50_23970 [Rhodobacterales bacterium]